MLSNYLKELTKDHEDLSSKIDSRQFKYSRTLIQKKHNLKLSQEEMAEILQLSLDDYIDMEFGERTVSLDEYLRAFRKLESIDLSNKPTIQFNTIYEGSKLIDVVRPLTAENAINTASRYTVVKHIDDSARKLLIDVPSHYDSHKTSVLVPSQQMTFNNIKKIDLNNNRDGEAA